MANRSCEACKAYLFDEETGFVERNLADNTPLERPQGTPLPCDFGKCPKGSPDAGVELSPRNATAWEHYRECRAVGQFPDDPVVRENAAIIRDIEDQVSGLRQQESLLKMVQSMAGVLHG